MRPACENKAHTEPALPNIVAGMQKLHEERATDVRTLLPILPGLAKVETEKRKNLERRNAE